MESVAPSTEAGLSLYRSLLNFEQKYEKKHANQTIEFWWELAKWGTKTGQTEYTVQKAKREKVQFFFQDLLRLLQKAKAVEVEAEEKEDMEEDEDEIVVKAPPAKKAATSKTAKKKN